VFFIATDKKYMGRYVKSISDTRDLSKSLRDLELEFKTHRSVVEKNNKEIEKINGQVDKVKEKERIAKAEELDDLQSSIQWVKNDEPAVKINPEHMLKKLNIL
jgi:predicted  nucleic acid-binding Zn-ribbon protein